MTLSYIRIHGKYITERLWQWTECDIYS